MANSIYRQSREFHQMVVKSKGFVSPKNLSQLQLIYPYHACMVFLPIHYVKPSKSTKCTGKNTIHHGWYGIVIFSQNLWMLLFFVKHVELPSKPHQKKCHSGTLAWGSHSGVERKPPDFLPCNPWNFIFHLTPLKTNMSSENRWLENVFPAEMVTF